MTRVREKQLYGAEAEAALTRQVDGGKTNGKSIGNGNVGHVATDQAMGIVEDEDAMDLE